MIWYVSVNDSSVLLYNHRLTINRPTFHSPDRVKVAKIVFFCYYHPTFHSSYLLRMQLSNHKRFIKTTPIFRKGKGRRFHTCADLRNITGSSSLNWTWRFCQFISIYRTIIFDDIVLFGKKSCNVITQYIVHIVKPESKVPKSKVPKSRPKANDALDQSSQKFWSVNITHPSSVLNRTYRVTIN